MEQFINGPIMVHVDRNALAAGHAACIAVYSPEGVRLVASVELAGPSTVHTCAQQVWEGGPSIVTVSYDGAWVPELAPPAPANSWGHDAIAALAAAMDLTGYGS